MNNLNKLEEWFVQNFDDWQNECSISIISTDHPGWSVKIKLKKEFLNKKEFKNIQKGEINGGEDWIECFVANGYFNGFGSPNKLSEIMEIFINWVK